MSVNPRQPTLKSGQYGDEAGLFTDINALFRSFATRALRPSRTSPPIANDVDELTFVYDKTLNRLYTKVNGSLRYVAFT
jgi:hypothetical protein